MRGAKPVIIVKKESKMDAKGGHFQQGGPS
jgi:hypothetical protein